MIHILGRTEQGGLRIYHAIQNEAQFKTYKLFLEISIHYFWTMAELG